MRPDQASGSDRREAGRGAGVVSVDDRASGSDSAGVLSGANFHGAVLAMRLDYLTNALTELAAISERRTDRMLNPTLQEPHLPPFLAEDSGLNSGFMIPQYTAASLINEIRATGRPSMDNTPVSGGQEDHVSMSATSGLRREDRRETPSRFSASSSLWDAGRRLRRQRPRTGRRVGRGLRRRPRGGRN